MKEQAYPNLISPYRIGNVVLKNRIYASASTPEFLHTNEHYPTEALIQHYANKAKTASIVTVNGWGNAPKVSEHALIFNFKSEAAQHQITRLTDSVHYYDSKAISFLFPKWDLNYDAGEGIPKLEPYPEPGLPAFTKEHIRQMIENYVDMSATVQDLGFDGIYLHAAYRGLPVARFLSPLTNNRKDEYGGCVENRARFLLEICEAIKKKCGRDFLIDVSLSGDDNDPKGATIEDTVKIAKLGEGLIDIIQPRAYELDHAHPVGYTSKKRQPYAYMAEKIKESGAKVTVTSVAGWLYPEDMEAAIRDGKTDLVAMGRGWVSNPDYGEKVFNGRRDDLVPCIRCNKCYNSEFLKQRSDTCSVNPTWSWDERLHHFVKPVGEKKTIAVVGGGPAGMEAAVECAKRGHSVTLFEKDNKLGGKLNIAGAASFKPYINDFRDYLVHQVEKHGVKVVLGTKANAAMLNDFDEVIAAVGADATVLNVPGSDGKNVRTAESVYGHENELPEKVVIVGGGEIGAETGMHLAELGHKVELIEMADRLAPDAPVMHFRSMLMEYAAKTENFRYTLNAKCARVTESGVVYTDPEGGEHALDGDIVLMAVGTKSRTDEALSLFCPGRRVMLIGDCRKASDIANAMRTGFAVASQL